MTNLQQGGSRVSGALLRRLWLGLPIAAGGLLALLLTAFVLVPEWLSLRNDTKRLNELEELQRDTTLMRAQLRATEVSAEKAEAQQARLFEIVSGNGDLSTFMAMVDREAGLAGVQLDLFEPQSGGVAAPAQAGAPAKPAPAGAPAAPAAPGAPAAAGAAPSGIEIPGLRRQSILITARGPFPALLDFLRRLERLNVLVVQTDLRLVVEESKATPGVAPTQTPVLKVLLSLYERPAPAAPAAGAAPPAAAARPGAPPGAAPGPGAPPPPAGSPAAPAQAPAR